MKFLILHSDLEACDGGKDQQEIADWIENDNRFIDFITLANKSDIPEATDIENKPSDQWLESQTFIPNDLIEEACEDLGWHSVPDNINIVMNFGQK